MSVSKKDSQLSDRRGASPLTPVEVVESILSPVDMLVSLLLQPERPRDGVREDFEAARQRQRR